MSRINIEPIDPALRKVANDALRKAGQRPKVLPFTPRMEAAVKAGTKTATSRTKRYGKAGDVVVTREGQRLLLIEVERVLLSTVRDHYWRDEGCESPEDFERVWGDIHPLRGYDGSQKVYLHRFVHAPADGNGDTP